MNHVDAARASIFRTWAYLLPIALACSACGSDDKSGDSDAFTALTARSTFEFFPLVVDGSGMAKAGACADHPGVYAVYETELSTTRYYRFCEADGTDLVLGQFPIGYGTPIYEGRFSWLSKGQPIDPQLPNVQLPGFLSTSSQINDTKVVAYYADEDNDGTADPTRLDFDCFTDPPLDVVSTTSVFDATVGTQVCTTPGFEDYFPVKYYISSLSPLRLRVVVPDGSEHSLDLVELPGSAAVVEPATRICGLSTCI